MSESEQALWDRQSALEFVVEVLLANQLALQPGDMSEAFKIALLEAAGSGFLHRGSGPVAMEAFEARKRATHGFVRDILNKIDARERQIREAKSQGPGTQQ